jgi:outer membrane beta-barrel protein
MLQAARGHGVVLTGWPTVAAALFSVAAGAAEPPPVPDGGVTRETAPVLEPNVVRHDISVPQIPSHNIEVGAFVGSYHTQNFGSALVGGVRTGYHLTQDFFSELTLAQTHVSDDNYRQILPGGLFPTSTQPLRYADISLGYNALPGEVFPLKGSAKVSALYVLAGAGLTQFLGVNHETLHVGVGLRVFLTDGFAIQADAREHFYSINLLGRPQTSENVELTLGATYFF